MAMPQEFDAKKIEGQVRARLQPSDTRRTIRQSDRPRIHFVEGPPTLNGSPHAGHLRGRIIKDLWYRYNTLLGMDVSFQGGWDTQGLPVELQAEKELGITKTQVEGRADIEKLVSACKDIVKRYNKQWEEADELMGMSMDHRKSYWTYKDDYIEREWQVLKKARDAGILEDDYTVIGYCPGCQTSLSHAEVNQGYDMVEDPSLYYKVRLQDEDLYLVVWTTMPFTLVTDAMVGLHPHEDYAIVAVDSQKWVVGRRRLEEFMKEIKITDYTIQEIRKGSAFEGKRYHHPLLDQIPALADLVRDHKYHTAVAEPFVDAAAGSGLVHLAPANGEEDIAIAKRRGIKVFCPLDEQVRFTSEAGAYRGIFVRDADDMVVESLQERGALVRIGRIRHKYPLCWRSRHPIVWLARRGWFYKLDRLGDDIVRAAESVRYFFDAPKNRFMGIVGERHPWCISRERYWGCPIPVWNCSDCHAKTWCHTRAEICDAAKSLPDGPDFELHRPWIDRISVRCQKCQGYNTSREQYVLDTWHNSGAAPFASQDDQSYNNTIPAPFFTEGIDQTRGWAYTLLVENVILNRVSPYKSFLFQGHVLDEKGGKMSKSLGNVINAKSLLSKYPADLVRLYFMWKASPVEALNFNPKEMMSRPYQILNTLYNLHLYYTQNSEYDRYDTSHDTAWAESKNLLQAPDRWLLSKLQGVVRTATQKNDECRFHEAARAIDDFLINTVSQSYIPSIRSDLWEDGESARDRRHAIYAVVRESLMCLDILLHPLCPFTTEYLYHSLGGGKKSILLESWPRPNDARTDHAIERDFDSMKTILSVAAAARAKARLKRRWPLENATVVVPKGGKSVENLWEMLQQQLNVESLDPPHESSCSEGLEGLLELQGMGMPIKAKVDMKMKRIGPRVKGSMAELRDSFAATDPQDIVESMASGGHAFGVGDGITLYQDDFVFGYEPADGHQYASRDGYTVFISTAQNDTTRARWRLRDVARRIQNLRKERGYNPTDILDAAYISGLDGRARHLVESGGFDLASAVRVKAIILDAARQYVDADIDGHPIKIDIS